MKLFAGLVCTGLLIAGVAVCPPHVREQAQEAATISPEMQAEVARQLDVFVSVMEGDTERPELYASETRSQSQ